MKKNPSISFDEINVNVIESNAGIFIGNNNQSLWRMFSKQNHGLGSISGNNNTTHHNKNIVIDPDTVDSPSYQIKP
ncbi:hypothetical protein HNQ94_001577 [Salirhabdus euzebyi]|uniref:Spore germination protein gerPA/gerPF n=1 Tax=Salirhabdus euzebyi TaxID=394506 RepID=A0A841Q3Z4_9BACI|nr:hypothetical protein [Salirhabdus euzebyi]MBB6453129.1 hypothetical protein [Salirhabdus euzebyi]